jgi:hypothetical protein
VVPILGVAILPNPVRRWACGSVFPAQNSKNVHLGSSCQATARWTCLLPRWFDPSKRSIVETRPNHPLRIGRLADGSMSEMAMFQQSFAPVPSGHSEVLRT